MLACERSAKLERDEITLKFFTLLQGGVKISFDCYGTHARKRIWNFMKSGRKTAPGFLHRALATADMMIAIFGPRLRCSVPVRPLFLLIEILMARGFLQIFHITPSFQGFTGTSAHYAGLPRPFTSPDPRLGEQT
jgi:hypothetical protein